MSTGVLQSQPLAMANLSYISPKAKVKKSPIHGRGLFAIEAIKKGEIVAVKGGHIFDREKLKSVQKSLGPAEIQIGEDLFIGPLTRGQRQGSMIFSNHSCDPNIGVLGQIVFVAIRNIRAGEELTHDWATTDDDTYRLKCNCGSANCRGTITGRDWKKKDLQKKYGKYMSQYLLERIKRRH
jgi:SET domain-containing protein